MRIGDKFGRLTVVKDTGRRKSSNAIWLFNCDCGKSHECAAVSVKRGFTKSCGCLRKEVSGSHQKTREGKSVEYRIWAGVKSRCEDPKVPHFHRYGGRGIKMCSRWQIFANFLADMGRKPKGYSLERIENDGDYEPNNCRWSSYKEQANNRSSNRRIIFDSFDRTLSQWSDATGIPAATIKARLDRGWSDEDSLKTPVRKWSH